MKRTPPDAETLYKYIARYPGYRMAEYAADFGVTAADLVAARLKLVRAGRIKPEGQTRAARWFVRSA